MKTGAKLLLPLITSALILQVSIKSIYAHPGNTASDGCHYCRTNCAKWGEVEGARHCHNAKSAPVIITYTPKPTPKPLRLTPKPIATFVPTITANPSPTTTSQVFGTETSLPTYENKVPSTPIPQLTAGDTVVGVGMFAAMIILPLWFIRKSIVKHNKKASA